MPELIKPTSDESRLSFLKTTLNANQKDSETGISYLATETLTNLNGLITVFENVLLDETGKLASRSKEVREKNDSLVLLQTFMRDVWESVKRRVYRKGEPAEVLTYYELPLDGTVPKKINDDEIFSLAAEMIEGDKKAVDAGYAAVVNPSVQELEEVMIQAKKEAEDVSAADRVLDKAQEAIAPLRAQVDDLIIDIIADLEYGLRKKDPAGRRRIMRSYGVTYKYAAGEPVETATSVKA